MSTGVKAIDGILTCGEGQRVGIFSGSGVGKSTLLGMIARYCEADVNVIGLIGERGREVLEFIQKDLGTDGYKKSVVVCATSDQPPLVRLKGAFVATAIAEYFRDQGKKVMLMMDSVTRFAMAQREIGLATGEPPSTKGYTPSVFALLPKLLERSGMSKEGSITAFYTVLVEGDDMNDPIADSVRGILDGHIILSREIAAKNHFPSIDIQNSISRVMKEIVAENHYSLAGELKENVAVYKESEDLINIGAYVKGSNLKIDRAITLNPKINAFLKQDITESYTFNETLDLLVNSLNIDN
jgi:flagellum-specific ATP synthase